MTINPINVLKRKLNDDGISLAKRVKLAKNLVHSSFLSSAPKERVIAEWLEEIILAKRLPSSEFRSIINWITATEEVTNELKGKFIELTAAYLKENEITTEDVNSIISLLESEKMAQQLSLHINEYCLISNTLLQYLKNIENTDNFVTVNKVIHAHLKYYKEQKKKLEFIIKILDKDILGNILYFLDKPECIQNVYDVIQTILFPLNKKSYFSLYLRTMLQKENLSSLSEEKGDNLQAVIKIMSTFYSSVEENTEFLKKFFTVFVYSFKTEPQLIFSFCVITAYFLNLEQNYIMPAAKITIADLNDKTKRQLFLHIVKVLLQNEIDLNVRLTDIVDKGHVKKNFSNFLQTIIMGILKLEGKPDKTSLEIIKTALKLDPSLIEMKLEKILPPILVSKKNSANVLEAYIDMLNCLIDVMFKLSKGTVFINQILPHVKVILEAGNTEQFELQQKVTEDDNLDSKIIKGSDLFPNPCVEMYGKMTSELMYRQNAELLLLIQKDFEDHCLLMLEEDFVSPSIITLAEVLAAILCNFLDHNKMADHTVPLTIAEEFWKSFQNFENDILRRLGLCVLKLNYNSRLLQLFLRISQSVAQLKLLNLRYSHYKLEIGSVNDTLEVYNLEFLLPCLSGEQWIEVAGKIQENDQMALDNLLITKTIATEMLSVENSDEKLVITTNITKTHLIKNQTNKQQNLVPSANNYVMFSNLDQQQAKHLAKILVKLILENSEENFEINEVMYDSCRNLSNAIVLETLRTLVKPLETENAANLKKFPSLSKALSKSAFEITSFLKDVTNVTEYFEILCNEIENYDTVLDSLEILKKMQIYFLEENVQLTTVFVLLCLKKSMTAKKVRKSIDSLLQMTFELSSKKPDLFKIFPIDYIFDFENENILNLVTLKLKNCNPLLVLECILESAVKKVKTNNEIPKIVVKTLLTNQKVKKENSTNIDCFSDKVFQISCLILPILTEEKRALTSSAHRSVLTELQDKLHKSLLKSFKSINLNNEKNSLLKKSGNPEDSLVVSETTLATLNAMKAFSLTLSKYCETTDAEDIKNLDYLWTGLEYFTENAITSIQTSDSKPQHVTSSIQLLNVVLRNTKKLETHTIFKNKDQLFHKIWQSVKTRLHIVFAESKNGDACLEDVGVTLKFLCELSSVDGFVSHFASDLYSLMVLKKLSTKNETQITTHRVAKYLWSSCLKANIIDKKCVAMSKSVYRSCRNFSVWIRQHYDDNKEGAVKIDDEICEILRIDLDVFAEVTLNAKKIPMTYKFLDAIFELQHLVQSIVGGNQTGKFEVTWDAYFKLFEGSLAVLNSLVVSRDELLEDRWPCYFQCYRALLKSLCERSTSLVDLEKSNEDRLAAIGHALEKLTQTIAKRKTHISRLSAYLVGDICTWTEKYSPIRSVRQHLENSIALLIQASDSTYCMAFLRRALAGSAGQLTATNMYASYKRYHKYVGNA